MRIIFHWCLLLLSVISYAQPKKWDVNNPKGPYKEFSFTVDEGTWMNLDIAPNGKEIVFDLLGDIYTMPIEGGNTKCIRSGLAMEVQPRYSPNGKQIFLHLMQAVAIICWVMDIDGKHARQVTQENFRLLNNGVWCPDGNYIIARNTSPHIVH
jgi:Tol biopolymer transport system component